MKKVFLALLLLSAAAAALQQGSVPGNYLLEKNEILALNNSNLTVEDFTESSVALFASSPNGILLPHFTIVSKNGFADASAFTVRYDGVVEGKAAIVLLESGARNESVREINESNATPTTKAIKPTPSPLPSKWVDFVAGENYFVEILEGQESAGSVLVKVTKQGKSVRKAPLNASGPDGEQQLESDSDGSASFKARKPGKYVVSVIGANGSAEYEKKGTASNNADWMPLGVALIAFIIIIYLAKRLWDSGEAQEIRGKADEFREQVEEKIEELKNNFGK